MEASEETHKRKIILYYILAIVIPCIILGMLAFRGIRNDQALMEREQARILQETAREIINEITLKLDSVETTFVAVSESVTPPNTPFFFDSLLNRYVAGEKVISTVFFAWYGQLIMLNSGILYLPDDFPGSKLSVLPGQYRKIMEPGWNLEYREKNYIRAVEYYLGLLSGTADLNLRGEIYNAIARIRKKQNDTDGALKTYAEIILENSDHYIGDEIPLGLVAMRETATIAWSAGDSLEALKTIRLLLGSLLSSRWEISKPYFANSVSAMRKIIESAGPPGSRTGNWLVKDSLLLDSVSALVKHTDNMLNFREGATALFRDPRHSEIKQGRSRFSFSGDSYLAAVVRQTEDKYSGIVYDQGNLLSKIVIPLIEKQAVKSKFSWKVTGRQGELLSESGKSPEKDVFVSIALPANLPGWTFLFYKGGKSLLNSIFKTGEGIFFYIFILIIVVLSFGLFFILYAVNNAMKLSRMKSNFITTVSHEFKSPLASIRQMAEMLEQDRVPDGGRKKKYYHGIVQQSERLTHLIENILNYTKMEERRREFVFQKTDIVPVISDVAASFEDFMSVQGFKIDFRAIGEIPEILFDMEAMEQVMHNLLDNACKYSGDSRKIEVTVKQDKGCVIISVKDYGTGIKKEDHDRIFSRFYRVGNELTQKVKGSGIGLTIVRQIVEAHHGEITVESELGKGSTFTVKIPVDRT